jgi:hypothetical protein
MRENREVGVKVVVEPEKRSDAADGGAATSDLD